MAHACRRDGSEGSYPISGTGSPQEKKGAEGRVREGLGEWGGEIKRRAGGTWGGGG